MFWNKYPYTDFHELNLDWFLSQFKELVTDWASFKTYITTEWDNIKDDWETLYNYVHDFFDNLDVQEQVDNKLDRMYADGLFNVDNVLTEKNVVFFGDSTTAGFVSDSGSPVFEPDESYPVKFCRLVNANLHNYAQGGATMTNLSHLPVDNYSLSLQIDACEADIGLANADYIFIDFGINDFINNAVIGTVRDVASTYLNESRFLDALRLGLKKIYSYNSKTKVILIVPHYSTRELVDLSTSLNSIGMQCDSYRNAIINAADYLGLPVVDFRKCGINDDNYMTYHNGDPFHLTRFGYTVQAEYLAKNWRNIQTGNKEERAKMSRTTYPLTGPNFFRTAAQPYVSNYINGIAFGLTPGQSMTSQEEIFLQTGRYVVSSTARALNENTITVEIIDADTNLTVHSTEARLVEYDEFAWHLFIPVNILRAKVKITNSAGVGNVIIGNFDIRPEGEQYAPQRKLQTVTPTFAADIEAGSPNNVYNIENKVLHIVASVKAVGGNHAGVGITFPGLHAVLNQIKVSWNVTGLAPVAVNFYSLGNDLVANFVLPQDNILNIAADIFLGDNTTAFDVIS